MNSAARPVPALSLDLVNERVHRGRDPLTLTPKAFAVLRHLMERPGLLTTKDALLAAVWPDTAVTDASLSTCVREIRRALGDTPAAPQYIQTVHRRGYRYIGDTRPDPLAPDGPLPAGPHDGSSSAAIASSPSSSDRSGGHRAASGACFCSAARPASARPP